MSQDARDSIYLWIGGIAVAAFFWASLKFNLFAGVPDWVVQVGQGLALLFLFIQLGSWLWSRIINRSGANG